MTREPLFIGLDLGTSSLKGVAVGAGGQVAARASASYTTGRPEAGAAEQAPADWWLAVESVVGQLVATGAPADRWAAIGLSGMLPTLVLADGAGEPVLPAITWQDARAEAEGDALRSALGGEAAGGEAVYRVTGQWVDGRYLLPMWLRLARVAPRATARATWLLGAKDWLYWRLTGDGGRGDARGAAAGPATDPSTATGFGCYGLESGGWSDEIVAAAAEIAARDGATGGTRDDDAGAAPTPPALPPVMPSSTTRPLCAAAAGHLGLPAGLPVCLGAADSVLGAQGLGVERAGQVACIAGTSTVLLGVSDRLVLDAEHRFLVTPLATGESFGLEMDLLATGSSIRWLAQLLGLSADPYGRGAIGEQQVMALAATQEPGAAGVTFLPFLAPGEQGALWDPSLAGTAFGLSLAHGPAHVARALIDGILLESRRCLKVLEEVGLPAGDVHIAGGSGTDPAFRRQLADASGRTVVAARGDETAFSALGAAALAAAAVGHGELLGRGEAGAATVVVAPDSAAAPLWRDLWERHERSRAAARSFYRSS